MTLTSSCDLPPTAPASHDSQLRPQPPTRAFPNAAVSTRQSSPHPPTPGFQQQVPGTRPRARTGVRHESSGKGEQTGADVTCSPGSAFPGEAKRRNRPRGPVSSLVRTARGTLFRRYVGGVSGETVPPVSSDSWGRIVARCEHDSTEARSIYQTVLIDSLYRYFRYWLDVSKVA